MAHGQPPSAVYPARGHDHRTRPRHDRLSSDRLGTVHRLDVWAGLRAVAGLWRVADVEHLALRTRVAHLAYVNMPDRFQVIWRCHSI